MDDEEKTRRITTLIEQQKRISHRRNLDDVSRVVEVLVEGPTKRHEHEWYGKSAHFKTTIFPHGKERAGEA